ncbi:DUF2252 domain-containing protein [Amnibacterium endophyticum]|uniref:DUF2252 domain-containing protein n=1 Tax=Amnibacterium endophyticum TaxID=2109337 RepID=A0ABW4LET2_9MICO
MSAAAPTTPELRDAGREARRRVPLDVHADLEPPRRDPVAILAAQNATREPDLVSLRMRRTLVDAFGFYRGTAAIMATDLAAGPATGLEVTADGDAHLLNFGVFASPERALVFDLNDFDEAGEAPWEWDVKRLAVSALLAARSLGADEDGRRAAAEASVAGYRDALAALAGLTVLERYYVRSDEDDLRAALGTRRGAALDRMVAEARRRTSLRAAERMTEVLPDGRRRFLEDPPVLVHRPDSQPGHTERLLDAYLESVDPAVRELLGRFRIDDVARKVVGVGSVGTRCWLLVLRGPDGEPLLLQIKQAVPSVLESHGGRPQPGLPPLGEPGREGLRVFSHQRVLQAVTDPFLGHFEGRSHDYYVRQYHDMKGAVRLPDLTAEELRAYVRTCGALLARAHAQSGAATAIAAYLEDGAEFDRAVAAWSARYAAVADEDHARVAAAFPDAR